VSKQAKKGREWAASREGEKRQKGRKPATHHSVGGQQRGQNHYMINDERGEKGERPSAPRKKEQRDRECRATVFKVKERKEERGEPLKERGQSLKI